MITNDQVQLALNVGQLGCEDQRIYFKMLEGVLTEEEIKAFQIVVAYFRLKSNPYRDEAMKQALADQLYHEFNKSNIPELK
jgi:hypothetical protein